MDKMLGELFGGGDGDDDPRRGQARDFVDRYMTGDPTEGYGEDEALDNFRRVSQHASPEVLQRATRQSLERLPEHQRAEFAEMLEQRQGGRGMVDVQRSGGRSGGGSGGGIDDLLGGLLGGGGAAGGGGLGGMLGGLLGGGGGGGGLGDLMGGGSSRDRGRSRATAGGDDMFGGLGDLMGSPVGKAVLGGIAAFAMKEMMGRR